MNAPVTLQQLEAGHDRSRYIGGSDIAAVLGVSPWKTPYDLWLDKVEPKAEDPALSERREKFFRNRKDQEPIIARRLEREYGIVVTRLSLDENPNRYIDAEHGFMVAEVDLEFVMTPEVRAHFPERHDFAAIPDGTLLNGEIKTVHPLAAGKWGEAGSEELPIEYAAQAEWGLGVTGRPACLVAALFGIDALLCFPVMADQETINAMRAKACTFWTDHVVANLPPDPVNIHDVAKLYRGFNGKPVDLSDEAYEALRNLDIIRGNISALENDKNELEWRIARCVAFCWGADLSLSKSKKPVITATENAVLLYGGAQAGTWNRQTRSGVDVKRLREEKPEIAATYATETQFRVFRTKKEKR